MGLIPIVKHAAKQVKLAMPIIIAADTLAIRRSSNTRLGACVLLAVGVNGSLF